MADIEAARRAFDRYDVDGDGFITAAEYKSVMAQLGDFHVTETVAQAVINAQDGNADGKLSWDEFRARLTGA
ncbi:EF-hand domain-containing protein [Streptomyces sudanensis]|uniref:EF-hand domain-containing protein n=1 Tax=Streptomyces sudanensis TaxID=436397 RepID=UPI0020CF9A95|nr:EF-hand domain-containing protein [Streptomyces sudanensis]MCP9957195.1 EF-hand domain-containing protein [Streptomyces sudanensis]MCP9986353.1 EF-hand domain-containing protein [Streptomyces sudanensis]MCQ0002241.1 EF-hand domain-containing protein [Streptomyces sudanensis]